MGRGEHWAEGRLMLYMDVIDWGRGGQEIGGVKF